MRAASVAAPADAGGRSVPLTPRRGPSERALRGAGASPAPATEGLERPATPDGARAFVRFAPLRRRRNPSKEIFSELDEINAQGPIFARSFQKTEGESKWGHEVASVTARPARPRGPVPWASCRLLTCPFAYL
ncbi:hypothetical protein QYE76_021831 [Lolium multiflorum]|uniref:Uncharacterized protein n=1 Tax=Lolium multiflorum TaxID=4521 RepID=A0AAD8RA96_LOLMU|nr:hypothetical protein QYE76_021831 [Lolium multiflorum]